MAALTGGSEGAVRQKREGLRIPNPEGGRPGWAEEEPALLGTLPDAEVAQRTGRTESAVTNKLNKLGTPTADDRRRLKAAEAAAEQAEAPQPKRPRRRPRKGT